MSLPATAVDLVAEQKRLSRLRPERYQPDPVDLIGGCFICFARGGAGAGTAGDHGWAAAVSWKHTAGVVSRARIAGTAGAIYTPGLLALREGHLLLRAVRALRVPPDVLLVNATGLDHPRCAGLALHLGAITDIPTIGVTNRTLVARGSDPGGEQAATSPLLIGDRHVGFWVRTRREARPVAVTAGWRTDPDTAVDVVLASCAVVRTPEPIRAARQLARRARATEAVPPKESAPAGHAPIDSP